MWSFLCSCRHIAHEVYLDFVGHGNGAEQLRAGAAALLRDGQQRRDIVPRMRVIRRQKGVVHVQLADGDSVGPGGPFNLEAFV